jgi:hypothetical protein
MSRTCEHIARQEDGYTSTNRVRVRVVVELQPHFQASTWTDDEMLDTNGLTTATHA